MGIDELKHNGYEETILFLDITMDGTWIVLPM